jgi:hypothetical protein
MRSGRRGVALDANADEVVVVVAVAMFDVVILENVVTVDGVLFVVVVEPRKILERMKT